MGHSFTRCPKDRYRRSVPVLRELNFVTFRQKCVEPQNQLFVAMKEIGDTPDNAGCVNLVRLERLHDVQKLIVNVGAVTKLNLDLVEVKEGIFDAKLPHSVATSVLSIVPLQTVEKITKDPKTKKSTMNNDISVSCDRKCEVNV
jgi:hypothetical protein